MNRIFPIVVAVLVAIVIHPWSLQAEPTALPYTFSAGSKARADEVNANFNALAAKLPKNVVVVSPNAAGQVASGTDLLNALAAIGDASGSNPYVIQLAPGTYDLGSASLVTKAKVDIVGSGTGSTIITSSNSNLNEGTVQAAAGGFAQAEIRHLAIHNTSTSTNGVGVTMIGGAAFLKDVRVQVGSPTNGYGIRVRYSPLMKDVTVLVNAANAIALDIDLSSLAVAQIWDSSFGAIGSSSSIGIRVQNASTLELTRSNAAANNGGSGSVNHGIQINGSSNAVVTNSVVDVINTGTSNAGISLTTTGTTSWFGIQINNGAASASSGVEVSNGQHIFSQSYIASNTNGVVLTGGSIDLVMTYFTQANSGAVTCSGVGPTGARFSASC